MSAPPVVRSVWVPVGPERAFEVFTAEIGAWWPLPTHGVLGDRSGGLHVDGGVLVERGVDGTEVVWGEVLAWEPPSRLVLTWHPGRPASEASQVEVEFAADGDGTRVLLEHRGWEAFGADAAARRRPYVGPGAWGSVLDHFADVAETRPDAADLTDLAAAYDAYLAEAGRGGFGPPPAGEWDADQVVAHLTLSDAGALAVCQALVHGRPSRFENVVCQDRAVLAAWVAASGDRDGLLARARATSRQLLAALARLSPEQLATEVPCRLLHDGEVVLDAPRPWAAMAIGAQASVHLPAHTRQLADLRRVAGAQEP